MTQAAADEAIYFDLHDFAPVAPRKTWLDGHFAHLSATSLSMFRRCPRQFQQRYILGRKEPPGEGMVLGNIFHDTLNYNYAQKIATHQDRPLSELVEYLQDESVPKVVEKAGGESEIRWDSNLDTVRSSTQRITAAYHAQVLPRMQPVAVEQRMEWHLGVPVPLIGYLDTILDDRIVDTKTGKRTESKVKPSWRLQGDLYSGYLGRPIEFQSINHKTQQPTITTALESEALVITPSQRETANLIKVLHQIVQQIEWMYERWGTEDLWPTWGRWADFTMTMDPCGFCGFRKDCPAWQ